MTSNFMPAGIKQDRRPRVLGIAAYCHTMAARTLLGVLKADGESLHWLSGGADFVAVADFSTDRSESLSRLLDRLGASSENIFSISKTALSLVGADVWSCFRASFSGRGETRYSMFLRRRDMITLPWRPSLKP